MEKFYKINLGKSKVFWCYDLSEEDFKVAAKAKKAFFPKQIHSNKILWVKDEKEKICDGAFTKEYNFLLGIKTADCVPLIVSGGNFVGAIHCGWRGLSKGILHEMKKIIEMENSFLKDCYFFLGPSIKKCCYKVGEEVGRFFGIFFEDGKLDLTGFIVNFLLENLVQKSRMIIDKNCTFCNKDLPSYRREKTKRRILTGILMKTDNNCHIF